MTSLKKQSNIEKDILPKKGSVSPASIPHPSVLCWMQDNIH